MISRNRRTLVLGILATATLVWSVIHHFDVPAEDMAWLFAYSVLGVFGIMLLAALAVAVLQGLRYLLRPRQGMDEAGGD